MSQELTIRIIDVVCTLIKAKNEMDSDDFSDVIDIIIKSIVVAYHKNDSTALEMILDRAESLTEAL